MDDLSGIVDDLRKKYCGLSGEVCYNERRQWALREYCRKENRMNQVNYQKELEKILNTLQEKGEAAPDYRPPRLFLHSCCAPCSSYCLEYLCRYFLITVFYYNPNISFSEEYRKRVAEQKRLIAAYNKEEKGWPIDIVEGDYEPERFYEMSKGYENCPEGGERCFRCFDLRLRRTVELAAAGGYDYFATTLTISPLKMRRRSMRSGRHCPGNMVSPGCPRISRKRTGIRDPSNCPQSMSCTGRITAAVPFPRRSGKHRL